MTNKKLLQKTIDKYLEGVTLGIYESDVIENFTPAQVKRISDKLKYGENADIKFRHNGETIMLEIIFMYEEVDITTMDIEEYNSYFGDNAWD